MINICAFYRLSKGKKGKKRQCMNDNVEKYNDIINLPHHISKKHPQMSIDARSAQFASFAALKGYDDEVEETSRLTSEKIEITEGLKMLLDEKINLIKHKISLKPKISVTYFIKDEKKSGGKYITVVGKARKLDEYKDLIILENGEEIPIIDISDIRGDIFKINDLE